MKNGFEGSLAVVGGNKHVAAGLAAIDVAGAVPGGGALGLFAKTTGTTSSVGDVLEEGTKSLKAYDVGTFKELKARSAVGDELNVHHVVQSKPGGQVISGYNRSDAPSIALPKGEYASIHTRRGSFTGTARSQLAKDVYDLRNNTNAPVQSMLDLINLNKITYPGVFTK